MRKLKKDRPKWQRVLTIRQIRHLEDMGIRTLHAAKGNADFQRNRRCEARNAGHSPGIGEPCFDCRSINIKLGLPI